MSTTPEQPFNPATATLEEIHAYINAADSPLQRNARKQLCYYRLYSNGRQSMINFFEQQAAAKKTSVDAKE